MQPDRLRLLRLLLIDDDEVSREVLAMLIEAEGLKVVAVESGDAALAWLAQPEVLAPDAILADLQMPGLTGNALAQAIRAAAQVPVLLAMSGSQPRPAEIAAFDGFLLKPFSMDDLLTTLAGKQTTGTPEAVSKATMLDPGNYDLLEKTMGAIQLRKLIDLCLTDAAKRIELMRTALAADDAPAYRQAAHAIKGGCGMIGATELYAIANTMEVDGPDRTSLGTLQRFVDAAARLQRMLGEQDS